MTGPVSRPRLMVMTTIPETLAAFMVPQVRALAANGYDMHVVSSPGPALDALAVGPHVQRHSIPIQRSPHPVRDGIALWHAIKLMRKVRPDVVHAHTPKAGLIGMAAAKLAGVPVRLYTVHGLPLLTRTGVWRKVLEGAERTSIQLATHTYVVSDSVRELLVQLKLCPAEKARVVGSGSCGGVNLKRFPSAAEAPELRLAVRRSYGIPPQAILATFVGRLARDKGIAVLAEAWPLLAAELPDLHLLLAGDRDDSDPVPEQVLLGLLRHPRVHFSGGVEKDDIPGVFAATDIGVLSTYREGLPQTALEAGAAAVPMVASRVSGVVSVIKDGVTGLLVPAGQPSALADAIRKLALDPNERRRIGDAARSHIRSHFSEDHVNGLWMAEYLRLVTTVLDQSSGVHQQTRLFPERTDAG